MTAAQNGSMVITGLGMRCAVGQNVIHCCAAVRAGISRFLEWPYMKDPTGEEETNLVAAAIVPDLGNCSWVEKFQDLLTQPLLESLWAADLANIGDAQNAPRWGIFLSIPPLDRPGIEIEDAEEFLEEIRDKPPIPCQPASIAMISKGHAGALLTLEQAMRALRENTLDICVVCGIDSLLETEFLSSLMDEGKLKTEANPAGLIPGEAGACIVLEMEEHARMRKVESLARLTPVRIGLETAPVFGEDPGRADVMAKILTEAISDIPCGAAGIYRIINDLNGERWRFLEWAMAEARSLTTVYPYRRLWHPADCFGDIGAASGAAHICIAVRAFQRSYAAGEAILVSSSSDSGERAATIVLPALHKS